MWVYIWEPYRFYLLRLLPSGRPVIIYFPVSRIRSILQEHFHVRSRFYFLPCTGLLSLFQSSLYRGFVLFWWEISLYATLLLYSKMNIRGSWRPGIWLLTLAAFRVKLSGPEYHISWLLTRSVTSPLALAGRNSPNFHIWTGSCPTRPRVLLLKC